MHITNQAPTRLHPVFVEPLNGPVDVSVALRQLVLDPLLSPMTPGTSVKITDDAGQPLSPDDLLDLMFAGLSGTIDPDAEKHIDQLLAQTMRYYDPNNKTTFAGLFVNQAAARCKLPAPGPLIRYGVGSDVIPAAKDMLAAGNTPVQLQDYHDTFFASLAFLFRPRTLGFTFVSADDFAQFTQWVDTQVAMIPGKLSGETKNMMTQFTALKLEELTESLLLRRDETEGNDPFSFPRLMVNLAMQYAKQNPDRTAVLPFTLNELLHPSSVVFVNVEQHARSSEKKIKNEWQIIQQAIDDPIKIITKHKLSKLTTAARHMHKISTSAAPRDKRSAQKAASVRFLKKPPTTIQIANDVIRVIKTMSRVTRSMNTIYTQKRSFLRASRRNPNDPNISGVMRKKTYYPDLHLFLDVSGSISQENYQDAAMMTIKMAKKLNCDLYITTFSHYITQEHLLRVNNRPTKAIWHEFLKMPKATGGTDFDQVWKYINASARRRDRLSIMVTDFEWRPRDNTTPIPRNLYYAPCSAMDWDRMRHYAQKFAEASSYIDPSITSRFLGMTSVVK